jgi:hypothetical protein
MKTPKKRRIIGRIAEPTLTEVRHQLTIEIQSWDECNREADGILRDRNAMHIIACLRKALKLMPKSLSLITARKRE